MSSQIISDTKTEILQTAQKLARETAGAFTIDDLVTKTGVSRATIYRQIGGKKALLKILAEEHGLPELDQPDARSRILGAARTLFGQYGFVSPTMDQIAAEAGVGVATVYRHFGDKPSLLKAFLQAFQPRLPTNRDQLRGNLRSDLVQLVASMIEFILQNQDMVRISFSNAHEWREELMEIRPFQERSLNQVASFLQNQIEAGQLRSLDPKKAAIALLGMILSFSLIMPTYYQLPDPEPKETAEFIVQLFLDGLRRKDAQP